MKKNEQKIFSELWKRANRAKHSFMCCTVWNFSPISVTWLNKNGFFWSSANSQSQAWWRRSSKKTEREQSINLVLKKERFFVDTPFFLLFFLLLAVKKSRNVPKTAEMCRFFFSLSLFPLLMLLIGKIWVKKVLWTRKSISSKLWPKKIPNCTDDLFFVAVFFFETSIF